MGIAGDHGKSKNLKKRRIGEYGVWFEKNVIPDVDADVLPGVADTHRVRHGREVFYQCSRHGRGCDEIYNRATVDLQIGGNPKDAVGPGIVPVVAEFISNEQRDENAGRKTHGKAQNIDDGNALFQAYMTPGDA